MSRTPLVSTSSPRSFTPIVARVGSAADGKNSFHTAFIAGFRFMSGMKISAVSTRSREEPCCFNSVSSWPSTSLVWPAMSSFRSSETSPAK